MFDRFCNKCSKKLTTQCWTDCKYFNIMIQVSKFNKFVNEHKSNIKNYLFFFNDLYYDEIKSGLNLNLVSNYDIFILSKSMQENEICIIVNKYSMDWGDVKIQ